LCSIGRACPAVIRNGARIAELPVHGQADADLGEDVLEFALEPLDHAVSHAAVPVRVVQNLFCEQTAGGRLELLGHILPVGFRSDVFPILAHVASPFVAAGFFALSIRNGTPVIHLFSASLSPVRRTRKPRIMAKASRCKSGDPLSMAAPSTSNV